MADPAALPPARHRRARRRRGVRRRAVPAARARWSSLLLGRERDDPWDPDRLVWPLLEAIDDSPRRAVVRRRWPPTSATAATATRPSCGATAATRWRVGSPASSRRTPCSGPPLVTDWREGRDTDGAGSATRRATCSGRPSSGGGCSTRVARGPAGRPARAHTARRGSSAGGDGLDLPARLSLFGHTRLPVTEVELLGALGEHRDVHLWLPQPSPALWDALADLGGVVARDDDALRRPGRAPAARLARPRRPRAAPHVARPAASRRATPPEPTGRSRPPCSAGSSTTCAPTTPRRSRSARTGS